MEFIINLQRWFRIGEGEVEKIGLKMIEAKACDIQVVSEEFLSQVKSMDPFVYIINCSLSEWGGNVWI